MSDSSPEGRRRDRYDGNENDDNEEETLRLYSKGDVVTYIPFKPLALFTCGCPLAALFYCLITGMIFQYESVCRTDCGAYNILPSVSAVTGIAPGRYIWRMVLAVHFFPRIIEIFLLRGYYSLHLKAFHGRERRWYSLLSSMQLTAITVEFIALLANSYIGNTENYPLHSFTFIAYMISCLFYMCLNSLAYAYTQLALRVHRKHGAFDTLRRACHTSAVADEDCLESDANTNYLLPDTHAQSDSADGDAAAVTNGVISDRQLRHRRRTTQGSDGARIDEEVTAALPILTRSNLSLLTSADFRKLRLFGWTLFFTAVLLVFFFQHKWHCAAYAFSGFSLCEYFICVLIGAFHMQIAQEFSGSLFCCTFPLKKPSS